MKIYLNRDGTQTTIQSFRVDGQSYHIINRGPYRIKNISKLQMKLRMFLHLKNPKNGIMYEVRKA